MNMKLKAIAAAVAMAAAGGAHAVTAIPQSGNSELIFTVWDPVAMVSFDFDLTPIAAAPSMGTFYLNDFLPADAPPGGKTGTTGTIIGWSGAAPGTAEAPGINWQWDITGLSETATAWAEFVSIVTQNGSSSANWQWFVGAADITGSTAFNDQYRYLSTSKTDLETVTFSATTNANMKNTNSLWNAMDAASLDPDPGLTFVNGEGDGYVGLSFQNKWQGGAPFIATAGLNESMGFYYITGNCTSSTSCETPSRANAQALANDGSWTFAQSGGTFTLSYTTSSVTPPPVPVPPALWLLGSALVGLVGIARRKVA